MIIEVCVFIRPVFLSNISTHWGPNDTYYMLWWTGTHWLRKCCINYFVSSHYVIQCWHHHLTNMNTSPSCQWTFSWKYNNSVSIFFSPAAAVTSWLSSRGCRLPPASPGLPQKVIQRRSLPDFMKDRLANDWYQINVDLGVLVIFGSCICLGEETSYHMS